MQMTYQLQYGKRYATASVQYYSVSSNKGNRYCRTKLKELLRNAATLEAPRLRIGK